MLSVHRTGAARVSLVVLSFLVLAVHSFIPATPSNATDATANLLNATLNIFWFNQGEFTAEFARAVATSDSGNVATGALVHYSDDASTGTTKTPWVALVVCDSNATDASQDDIFARAKSSGAQAAVLYSLFSQTCVVTPNYSNSPLDVYVSKSLTISKLIETTFQNVDATKFSTFDPATLDSESANIAVAPSDGFKTVDPGYAVAIIAAHVPIFSSVYTSLPTSTGGNSNSNAATTASLAPDSANTSSSGNANAAAMNGLPALTLAGGLVVALSLTILA
ncbi:hypothetical protein L226DRAFT_565468 [Lentinus tigrinus ALCF2SS1-7]|uniref:DUF3533 domain-containing protein n=1 Tax=Lentinus tigrinus ALCF2SS1-6 TaxID=1328759 RepID=A0A5C2SSP6_9APHY|nr:hypothetical protein L227DRAFT_243 [Lentinus tigrinus ALCF2SS1-6]RPD80609.1 hypothetical protein L226DRAFT_565468 [Lentinus tigrinus ALCF2SS1-7]